MEELNLSQDITKALVRLEYDVQLRNVYMNTRDRYLYRDGLFENLDIDDGNDRTRYNFLARVVDIHTAQFMGRGFVMNSYFSKEDLSVYDPQQDAQDLEAAELRNRQRKARADARKKAIDAIIRDNGGMGLFKHAARIASGFGETGIKMYRDPKAKKIVLKVIENPQNYRAGWKDDDFRERDFDAYVYQISEDSAYREYGKYLKDGETFSYSTNGQALSNQLSDGNTNDPLNQLTSRDKRVETTRPMVTVVDFTGYLKGWKGQGKEIVPCKRGEETPFSVLVVGGHVCNVITKQENLPAYYILPNRRVPRRAWGESDLPQSALDINETYVQVMSDMITWGNKNLWGILKGRNMTLEQLRSLANRGRKTKAISISDQQDVEEMAHNSAPLQEWERLANGLLDSFVRITGIGRVLFDDPTVNAGSNQALITTMKGVIDIVEDKQSIWGPVLEQMFTDALHMAAIDIPELKDAIDTDEDWYLQIEWPSVLRNEDTNYQAMMLNLFNAGVLSLDTYMEKIGIIRDTGEEMNRLRDNYKDTMAAAILGGQRGELAHQTINKALGIPPWGYVLPKVNLRGDLAPEETGNMAHNFGWDQGPYGPGIGPTGNAGLVAGDNYMNAGLINGNPFDGGTPVPTHPADQQANPIATPDQNHMAPVSQPGSGAAGVTPQGAVAQAEQHGGR